VLSLALVSARIPPYSAFSIPCCSPLFRSASLTAWCTCRSGVKPTEEQSLYPLYQRFRANLSGSHLKTYVQQAPPSAASASLPGADPIPFVQANVSANYFDVLGVRILRGQAFGPEQDKIGSAAMTVVSERFWTNRLGSDPGIIGKTLLINESRRQVIGIVGGNFSGVEIGNAVDLWVNVTSTDSKTLTMDGWNFSSSVRKARPQRHHRPDTSGSADGLREISAGS